MEFHVLLAVVSVSIVSAVGAFLWWLRKNDDYWEKRGVPYSPRVSLITVWRTFLSRPIHEIFLEEYQKYGRLYGGFEMRKPNLTVCDPDLLREILVKDFHVFPHRRDFISGEVFDKAVSVLKGEDWKRVRTIMTPAFTARRMRQIANIINECSQTVVKTFGKHVEQGETVDVKSIFGAFTMDVIASAAFATKIDSHNDPQNVFVKNVKKAFFEPTLKTLLVFSVVPTWITVKFRLLASDSLEFFRNITLQVIQERRQSGKKYDDMLQLLLDCQGETEAEKLKPETKTYTQDDESDQFGSVISSEMTTQKRYQKMSEDEILAQCVLFFIVGYETSASTMSFMAYALATNPECQEKLIKEVDEVYKKHEKFDCDILREMKYLDFVVSETLRMYPVVIRSDRTACEDYELGNTGIVIEKGTSVGFNIHVMHHDPEFFANPEKFDPERFSAENSNHPQYAYLPFGAGPRNCLGMRFALMEIKLCICHILRYYRFKKANTTEVPLKFKKGSGFLTVEKLPLLAEKRME